MKKGEVRELHIPAVEGYGDAGFPDFGIPPNGDLKFELEVLHIGGSGAKSPYDDPDYDPDLDDGTAVDPDLDEEGETEAHDEKGLPQWVYLAGGFLAIVVPGLFLMPQPAQAAPQKAAENKKD